MLLEEDEELEIELELDDELTLDTELLELAEDSALLEEDALIITLELATEELLATLLEDMELATLLDETELSLTDEELELTIDEELEASGVLLVELLTCPPEEPPQADSAAEAAINIAPLSVGAINKESFMSDMSINLRKLKRAAKWTGVAAG